VLTAAGKGVEWVEDRVGLITPRILSMIVNEAAFAVMEGVAEPLDIDRAMCLGTNYPKGPLAWGDEMGLDYVVMLLEALYEEYHDERYRPCVLLKQMVRGGRLGKREGAGFYPYVL
jgi:3-hydroxybutyryl-CoA dehydrogenase